MSTEKEKRAQINLRISDETREMLAALASEDRRTMAQQFQWLVEQEWRRRKAEKHDR